MTWNVNKCNRTMDFESACFACGQVFRDYNDFMDHTCLLPSWIIHPPDMTFGQTEGEWLWVRKAWIPVLAPEPLFNAHGHLDCRLVPVNAFFCIHCGQRRTPGFLEKCPCRYSAFMSSRKKSLTEPYGFSLGRGRCEKLL